MRIDTALQQRSTESIESFHPREWKSPSSPSDIAPHDIITRYSRKRLRDKPISWLVASLLFPPFPLSPPKKKDSARQSFSISKDWSLRLSSYSFRSRRRRPRLPRCISIPRPPSSPESALPFPPRSSSLFRSFASSSSWSWSWSTKRQHS